MKASFFAVGVTIVAVAAAIAATSVSWLFWDAWKATDLEAFRAIVGAFSGAFFAYLFVRFGDALKKVYDRKEANHTALVTLQHYFNDCLSTTSDNVFVIDNCATVFTNARMATEEVPIYMNSFHQYQINKDLVVQLTNVEFLNEVFSLNVTLRKMNDSLATLDNTYSQLRDAYLAKSIDVPTYKANALRYRDRSVEIKGFLMQLKDDLIRLLAVTSILMEDRPFLARITLSLVRTTYPNNFDVRVHEEKARVVAEIAALGEASAKKILAAQGMGNDAQPCGAGDPGA